MKKYTILLCCTVTILGIFIYVRSQNETPKEEKVTEPVANIPASKQLLTNLERQLITLQIKMSEHSQRLAGVYAKWKREGKIKQAEQWDQTKNGIIKLLSELKIVKNSSDLIEKLRRNKELFEMLSLLNKEVQQITVRQPKEMALIMQLASLYGKTIFNNKLLEKIEKLTPVAPKEKDVPSEQTAYSEPYYDESAFTADELGYDFEESSFEPSYDYSFDQDVGVDDWGDFDFGFDF